MPSNLISAVSRAARSSRQHSQTRLQLTYPSVLILDFLAQSRLFFLLAALFDGIETASHESNRIP